MICTAILRTHRRFVFVCDAPQRYPHTWLQSWARVKRYLQGAA